MMTRKQAFKIGVTLLGIGAVIVAARGIDLHAVGGALAQLSIVAGVAAIAMVLGKLAVKAVRSQVLLVASCRKLAIAPPRFSLTYRLLLASHAAGQLAWGPLGFTVRTFALRDQGMPLGAVARVHVAERIAEALGIVAVAAIGLAIAPALVTGSWFGRVLLAVLAVVIVAVLIVALSTRVRARLGSHAELGGTLAKSAAAAFASSLIDIGILLVVAHGLGVALAVPTALLAFLAINGACTVPITPAGIGIQESAITLALGTAGISPDTALACALAYRAVHVLPLAILGLPALLARRAR